MKINHNKNKSKKIAFAIPWAKPTFWGLEQKYLVDALRSTWISDGAYIKRFEQEFNHFHNTQYSLTTANGTAALHLALLSLGIKSGDEVIIPGYGFAAALHMTLFVGAHPVLADVDPHTWCLDPESVKQKITKKTKAIIVIHTYGNIYALNQLKWLAKKYNCVLIEDVAEALFSRFKNKLAGTFGHIGCFSFQAAKTLTMGEGGLVVTKDKTLFHKMELIRNHGMQKSKPYFHEEIGHNFRLTNLQASIGCAQFKQRKKIIQHKKRVYAQYLQNLKFETRIELQTIKKETSPLLWVIALKLKQTRQKRDTIIKKLAKKGIETRPGFASFANRKLYDSPPKLKHSEDLSEKVICLPSFATLTKKEIRTVCLELKKNL